MNDSPQRHFTRRQIPQGDPRRKVEVVVSEGDDGRRQVLLRDLSFGPGVGWYVQKTIRLDAEQLDALLRSLCCARQPCTSKSQSLPHDEGRAKVPPAARIIQLTRCDREVSEQGRANPSGANPSGADPR